MAAANMKAVKLRIKSIQNTMQITKAMELVASSKLRKAKDRADADREKDCRLFLPQGKDPDHGELRDGCRCFDLELL